jgi:hypothetical protein
MKKDELYCEINISKLSCKPILNLKALRQLEWFIKERYNIHINKDVKKLSPPWTKNKHLQTYKYTNIRREHDKETIYLIKNVSKNKSLSYKNKLLNSFLFRLINNSKYLKEVSFPFDFNNLDFKELKKIQDKIGFPIFNSAFMVIGYTKAIDNLYGNHKLTSILKYVEKNKEIIISSCYCKNQKEFLKNIKTIRGIGDFMAYQIFLDFTYIKEFPFTENEFVKAGPGCRLGLDLLFKDKKKLNNEELLFWLRDNQENIFKIDFNELMYDLNKNKRNLNVSCLEHTMCEFFKFYRSEILKSTKPKKLYKGIIE